MLKLGVLASLLAFSIHAPQQAQARPYDHVEGDDYASSAIRAGDYRKAERQLIVRHYTDFNDPARLINIATIYAATGRVPQARKMLKRVSRIGNALLILDSGEVRSSKVLARLMLSRLGAA